jgi:hypothetical protein
MRKNLKPRLAERRNFLHINFFLTIDYWIIGENSSRATFRNKTLIIIIIIVIIIIIIA